MRRKRSAQELEESGTEDTIGGPVQEVHQFVCMDGMCVVEAVSAAQNVCQEENWRSFSVDSVPPLLHSLRFAPPSRPSLLLMLINARRRSMAGN